MTSRAVCEVGGEVGGHVVERPGLAVERVSVDGEPALAQCPPEPIRGRVPVAPALGQAPQAGEEIRGDRVGDVVGVGLDVDADLARHTRVREIVDEDEVGEQFGAGIVGDEADLARLSAQIGPYGRTVVMDQMLSLRTVDVGEFGVESETEVGLVSPDGTEQNCLGSIV